MTRWFFERTQMTGITPAGSVRLPANVGKAIRRHDTSQQRIQQKPPVSQNRLTFLTVLFGIALILFVIATSMFIKGGSGHQGDSKSPQGHSSPAPLDLYP